MFDSRAITMVLGWVLARSRLSIKALELPHPRLFFPGLVLATLVAALTSVIAVWLSGQTLTHSIGGTYQFTDAENYWRCGNSLMDYGEFAYSWCQRRVIYPSMLASLAGLLDRNIILVLLAQVLLLTWAILAFGRRCLLFAGPVGVIVSVALLLIFARVQAFTVTMSEVAGLLFGLLGFALLISAAASGLLGRFAAGVALLSIALNARAGAFFVLPLLVLWAGIVAAHHRRLVWRWLLVAAVASSAGFLFQAWLVSAAGGDATNSHGNFSYTLYGLSQGGAGWQSVLRDHPDLIGSDAERSKQIYRLALQNIVREPKLFMQGIWKNLESHYFEQGSYGFKRLGKAATLGWLLWWAGWVPILANLRKPAYQLPAVTAIGVAASAAFIYMDGGTRIFAATIPMDAFQMGLGAAWVVNFGIAILRPVTLSRFAGAPKPYPVQAAGWPLAVFLLALVIWPHFRTQPPQENWSGRSELCDEGEIPIVARLGRSTQMLAISNESEEWARPFQGEMSRGAMMRGLSKRTWYYPELAAFEGGVLLSLYQLDRADPSAPGLYTGVSYSRNLASYRGKLAQICLSPERSQMLLGRPYPMARVATILEPVVNEQVTPP